jgi:hypothetical protein
MAKAIPQKSSSKLDDHMIALKGNTHFLGFIEELKVQCRYNKSVFDPVNDRQTCYRIGQQDVAKMLVNKLESIRDGAE